MRRFLWIASGIGLLSGGSFAQHDLSARRIPVSSPMRHAGTVHVLSGRWSPPGRGTDLSPTTVFNNTCTWTVGQFYNGLGECEDSYDEGRVPSPSSPGTHVGAALSQAMLELEFSYCTYNATPAGGMNMELAFWDKLNGDCIGAIPISHSNTSGGAQWTTLADFYVDTSGLGLPGSTANGVQSCWIVSLDVSGMGWTMASDGEGTFNSLQDQDKFIWGKRINDQSPGGSSQPNGFTLSADPAFAAPGSCTYTNPCQADVFSGLPCGTGLDTWDGSWVNVDGVPVGSPNLPPFPCLPGVATYGYGTNCYWLGGYPTNVFDSYYLRLDAELSAGPATFCTSKPSSLPSCTPTLSAPSGPMYKGAGGTALATASPVPGGPGKPGILIYTKSGLLGSPINTAFGFICLNQFQRAGAFPASPGGTNGICNGAYSWNLQAILDAAPSVNAGDSLHFQAWYRDPPNPGAANFTHGQGPIAILAAPTLSGVTPSSGGEGTVLTILGSNFGSNPLDLQVLLADGTGFADVTAVGPQTSAAEPNTGITATVFSVGSTGIGPVTVILGTGSNLGGLNVNVSGIASTSTLVRQLVDGSGTNFGSFNLTPGSNDTVSAKSNSPMPGGLTLDMTATGTNSVLEYRFCIKSSGGKFFVCQGRIEFVGTPDAVQKAEHLASHLNTSFAQVFTSLNVTATPSGTFVRISTAGAAYGGVVVSGK